jgi:hypothetical protein
MINKKLLGDVLEKKIGSIEEIVTNNLLRFSQWDKCVLDDGEDVSGWEHTNINIHELANKCVIKAKEKGFIIDCYPHPVLVTKWIWCISKFNYSVGITERDFDCSNEDSQPEAIFAAFEAIALELKNEKK